MKITNITASAGRTFNHPHESFSNLRFDLTLAADLTDGHDPVSAAKELQAQAEKLAEAHKQMLKRDIQILVDMARTASELSNLEAQLRRMQERVEEMRRHKDQFTGTVPGLLRVVEDTSQDVGIPMPPSFEDADEEPLF